MAKQQITKPQNIIVVPAPTTGAEPAQQVVSPDVLASILKDKGVHPSFLSFKAQYAMDELDNRGQPKRMRKRANPFLGRGVIKHSTVNATVNWHSSKKKTESRGGEWSGRGTWHTVVIVGNQVTPLSVHKDDVLCESGQAVIKDGLLVYTVHKPRFYLRYEIVRRGEEETRSERTMMVKSFYQAADGTLIDREEIEPYLRSRSPRVDNTDIQVTALDNIRELTVDGIRFHVT